MGQASVLSAGGGGARVSTTLTADGRGMKVTPPRPSRKVRRRTASAIPADKFPSLSDSFLSRVNPSTAPRPCGDRVERRYASSRTAEPPKYPHYYLNHVIRQPARVEADGRVTKPAQAREVCDDCHNEWALRDKARIQRWEAGGEAAVDGIVRTDAQILADAPADPDSSQSGSTIEALGNAVILGARGEPYGVELAEGELLPDGEAALLKEIRLGVLAPDGREDYDDQVELGQREWDAAAEMTAVDPKAVVRLLALAGAANAGRMAGA